MLGSAGLVVLLQFAENPELLVDEVPDLFEQPAPAVSELSQEFFVVKPSGQTFADFLRGAYSSADFDTLFLKGAFGDRLSRPHAGSRRAPARRPSSFGVELNHDHLFEAGRLVRRPPAQQLASACVQVRGKLDVRDRGQVISANVRSAALEVGADARVTGAVQVLGDGSLRSRARVEGDLSLGGSVGIDQTEPSQAGSSRVRRSCPSLRAARVFRLGRHRSRCRTTNLARSLRATMARCCCARGARCGFPPAPTTSRRSAWRTRRSCSIPLAVPS